MVAIVRERWAVSKKLTQKFGVEGLTSGN